MTKVAIMPIYGQNLYIILLLRNHKFTDLEAGFGLSGTPGLQTSYK